MHQFFLKSSIPILIEKMLGTVEELKLGVVDFLLIFAIGCGIYVFLRILYPKIIKFNLKRGWYGYDIHKTERPKTAESGGIGIAIGGIIGIAIVIILYQNVEIVREGIVLITTILAAAIIGMIDDRVKLSSLKKIGLMLLTGIPLFVLNWVGYISVDSPVIPILGQLRLTFIYPLVLPLIIAILTNTVNMLEGYNGEGSGTCSIALIFMIIAAIIGGRTEAILFGVPCVAAILAFYKFNKYPAKIFPGDVGTLTMGAMIGGIAILGSLEVVMFCVMLTHIFNSFYVLTSIRGFKESGDIKIQDIYLTEDDLIHASEARKAPMTLPRLILVFGPLTEKELVQNFMAIAFITGIYALVAELTIQWTLPDGLQSIPFTILLLVLCGIGYLVVVHYFPRVFGLSVIMMVLLGGGAIFLYFIDLYILDHPLNVVIAGILTFLGFGVWYFIQVRYFWSRVERHGTGNLPAGN